jgi:hypothetical protein
MEPHTSFTQQFFAVSPVIPSSRVVLAGGLYPLRGARSAYRASLACYDYAEGSVVWLYERAKCYPFRATTHTNGICAALLGQNFVRCPTGMFRFDLESGEPLEPPCEVQGWKIDFLDAAPEAFLFSWADRTTSFMRAVVAHGGSCEERSFPYDATSGGKTIQQVIAAGQATFVAIFGWVQGKRVVYSVEKWSMDSANPIWEQGTTLERMIRNDSLLLLWGLSGPALDIAILSLENGNVESSFRLPLAGVVSIQPIAGDSYAILSVDGAFVMDAVSQTVRPVSGMGPGDLLDFGALAVDTVMGKLIVVTAGNHQRPGTHLRVLNL